MNKKILESLVELATKKPEAIIQIVKTAEELGVLDKLTKMKNNAQSTINQSIEKVESEKQDSANTLQEMIRAAKESSQENSVPKNDQIDSFVNAESSSKDLIDAVGDYQKHEQKTLTDEQPIKDLDPNNLTSEGKNIYEKFESFLNNASKNQMIQIIIDLVSDKDKKNEQGVNTEKAELNLLSNAEIRGLLMTIVLYLLKVGKYKVIALSIASVAGYQLWKHFKSDSDVEAEVDVRAATEAEMKNVMTDETQSEKAKLMEQFEYHNMQITKLSKLELGSPIKQKLLDKIDPFKILRKKLSETQLNTVIVEELTKIQYEMYEAYKQCLANTITKEDFDLKLKEIINKLELSE